MSLQQLVCQIYVLIYHCAEYAILSSFPASVEGCCSHKVEGNAACDANMAERWETGGGSVWGMYNYLHHCISLWKQTKKKRARTERWDGGICNILTQGEKCWATRREWQREAKDVIFLHKRKSLSIYQGQNFPVYKNIRTITKMMYCSFPVFLCNSLTSMDFNS